MANTPRYVNNYIETVKRNLGDPPGVGEEFYLSVVDQAVRIYSRHRPHKVVTDITGSSGSNGSGIWDFAVPADWVDGYSSIYTIEYPYDGAHQAPSYLRDDDYTIYRYPPGSVPALTIRLYSTQIQAGNTMRITYAVPHSVTLTSTSVPYTHEDAVANIATSILAELQAAEYTNFSRTSIDDIAQDFRNKAYEWQAIADRYMTLWRKDLGIKDGEEVDAAWGQTSVYEGYSYGGFDLLTHPRFWH